MEGVDQSSQSIRKHSCDRERSQTFFSVSVSSTTYVGACSLYIPREKGEKTSRRSLDTLDFSSKFDATRHRCFVDPMIGGLFRV